MKEKIKKKKELKALNPMLFLVAIMLIVTVASYIVPVGSYERIVVDGQEMVDPASYHPVERSPITPFNLLISVTLGMQRGSAIIFFLLIIGAMFAILDGTGAINAGMTNVVRAMKGKELLMIPVCMIVFGMGSAFCANFEEFLAFVPLVLACCLTMGFDSLTAVGIIFCAAASGYGGAITNAFTTGIAQSIAGLPMFSGMGLRIAVFVTLLSVSIIYVTWHALRVKKNPQLREFLAFVPLVLACCLTMGFDSLTAVGIIFCAAASGYGGAITNAFTTGSAQSIAGLPMFYGMGLRIAVFVTLLSVSIIYVTWHALRVKNNPQLSSTYDVDRLTAM